MSLKLNAPAKNRESSLIRKKKKKKKKQEKCLRLRADLSAWQIGEVTVAVFGIFEIRHKKKKKKNKKKNGVEADTSMTLCWKAPWSLTFGGLSTSSEVERLVPSSHATAEEEETVLVYVWIHVSTVMV